MVDFVVIIGIIGMLFLLSAFVGNMFKRISPDSILYNALNIAGCGLLVYYALVLNSIPFLILEGVWGLFAVYNIFVVFKKKKHF